MMMHIKAKRANSCVCSHCITDLMHSVGCPHSNRMSRISGSGLQQHAPTISRQRLIPRTICPPPALPSSLLQPHPCTNHTNPPSALPVGPAGVLHGPTRHVSRLLPKVLILHTGGTLGMDAKVGKQQLALCACDQFVCGNLGGKQAALCGSTHRVQVILF